MQKMINLLVLNTRFFVNDGKCLLSSKLPHLCKISVDKDAVFIIGKDSTIQQFCVINIGHMLEIGNGVMIASHCFITDYQHQYIQKENGRKLGKICSDCIIGDGTFIGSNSTIISSKIGKNCIIGANSCLIGKTLEDGTMFVGDSRLQSNQPYRISKPFVEETWEKH